MMYKSRTKEPLLCKACIASVTCAWQIESEQSLLAALKVKLVA